MKTLSLSRIVEILLFDSELSDIAAESLPLSNAPKKAAVMSGRLSIQKVMPVIRAKVISTPSVASIIIIFESFFISPSFS